MAKLTVTILAALALASPALAKPPRPDCGKPRCHIHWVSYSYEQHGRGSDGKTYVRTCYVPAYGKRHCGPWILERHAFLIR